MSKVLAWLVGNRFNAALAAIAVLPLLPMISSAITALDTLTNGLRPAALSALMATIGMGIVAVVLGQNPAGLVLLAGVALFAGVVFGGLLGWSGSLGLVFQVQLLAALVGVIIAMGILGSEPEYFEGVAQEVKAAFEEAQATPEQIAAVDQVVALLFGGVAALMLVLSVGIVCLARFWQGLLRSERLIGQDFRSLSMGAILTVIGSAIVVGSLATGSVLLDNLAIVFIVGFAVVGLSAWHQIAQARQWSALLQALPYVLLLLPTAMFVGIGLAALGLSRGWTSLRKRRAS